jgi:hypothetical protein
VWIVGLSGRRKARPGIAERGGILANVCDGKASLREPGPLSKAAAPAKGSQECAQ